MTILIDIDNTINNFSEILLKEIQKSYISARQYSYKDILHYNWFEKLLLNPWARTEYNWFWDNVEINSEAVETIESWIKQGHKVFLVTASHFNNAIGYKIQKTLEPFDSALINESNVIIAQDKSIIMGDVMIDDYIDNLKSFGGARICFAQPWNREYRGARSCSWSAINKVIKSITSY